jgi:pimeloyl-ACP methyl ester carboxylesterase
MPLATISQGVELFYERFGPTDGTPVVLIRGTGADSSRWMPQVEAYRHHFPVLIFDNRGAGKSSAPPGPYTVDQMADDTIGLLDHVGIGRCHLSGSSLGGAIALRIAVDQPERVASLQLHSSWLATDGYARYSLGLLKRILELGGTDFYYEATLPLLFSPRFLSSDFDRLQTMLSAMRANAATVTGLAGQIEANLTHDLRGKAAAVTAPTLVTVGDLDVLLPVAASRELAAAIPGAELVVFDGAGHLATMEAADRFNEVTLAWLQRVDES